MKKSIKIGSQFTGVGAFEYAINRIATKKGYDIESVYAAEWDKYARKSYLANHIEPKFYVKDVNDTPINQIPQLDVAMFSPPCQSFSIAGKRGGKNDKRGVLFFNSHEFIKTNKPRYFIFENVKGLLSDDNGNTFNEWVNMLGGKSVNGLPILFPYDNSVPYHIYWKVLNAKKHGVPQNRDRVFIVGIRDDEDNQFTWPKEIPLTKKLKDILENEVDEKYFLSDKMVENLIIYNERQINNNRGFSAKFRDVETIKTMDALKCGGGGKDDLIKIKSATKSGYETATTNDSINFSVPNSETRRGRVGKEVAQTLDTQCNQGIIQLNNPKHSNDRVYSGNGIAPTLNTMQGGNRQPFCCVPVLTPDRVEKRQNGRRFKEDGEEMFTITTQDRHGVFDGFKIRRLTPLECFRLMAFPDSHVEKCKEAGVSDSQLYKQAGNSIVVDVLSQIIDKFKL